MHNESISENELKALILANFNHQQSKEKEWRNRIKEASEEEKENPAAIEYGKFLFEYVASILAHRLKKNKRAIPLFSNSDFIHVVSLIVVNLKEDEQKELENVIEELSKFSFDITLHRAIPFPVLNDPYESYWN